MQRSENQKQETYRMVLPPPSFKLNQIFQDIKAMQKDNLNDIPAESKDEKHEQEIKGLKFISKKLKILLEKNRKIQYSDASRILINNFANAEKDQRNIKRRVYDAINVLVATEVILKDGNKIEWNHRKKQPSFPYKVLKEKDYIERKQIAQQMIRKKRIGLKKFEKLKILLNSLSFTKKTNQKSSDNEISVLEFHGNIDKVNFKRGKKKSEIKLNGKGVRYLGKTKNLLTFLSQLPQML